MKNQITARVQATIERMLSAGFQRNEFSVKSTTKTRKDAAGRRFIEYGDPSIFVSGCTKERQLDLIDTAIAAGIEVHTVVRKDGSIFYPTFVYAHEPARLMVIDLRDANIKYFPSYSDYLKAIA